MSLNYHELNEKRDEIAIQIGAECNPLKRSQLQDSLRDVESKISQYDLSDDDLFKCQRCNVVLDIEDSVQFEDDELYCESCYAIVASDN
tara:strand:- start:282 stop:548 length:267 start_codon:yes stop_codon:yes gene_type:complete